MAIIIVTQGIFSHPSDWFTHSVVKWYLSHLFSQVIKMVTGTLHQAMTKAGIASESLFQEFVQLS